MASIKATKSLSLAEVGAAVECDSTNKSLNFKNPVGWFNLLTASSHLSKDTLDFNE